MGDRPLGNLRLVGTWSCWITTLFPSPAVCISEGAINTARQPSTQTMWNRFKPSPPHNHMKAMLERRFVTQNGKDCVIGCKKFSLLRSQAFLYHQKLQWLLRALHCWRDLQFPERWCVPPPYLWVNMSVEIVTSLPSVPFHWKANRPLLKAQPYKCTFFR